MIISFELDTNVLKILNVNLAQLILINLLHQKVSKTKLKEFIKLALISEEEFNDLISKDIITKDSVFQDHENIKLDAVFVKKYKELSKDDFFEDFLEAYPKTIVRPDGIHTFIRTSPKRCQQLYKQLVGNDRDKHLHILNCLIFELDDRELTGTMAYMKTMPNWLTQEGWLYSEDRLLAKQETILPGYGESII